MRKKTRRLAEPLRAAVPRTPRAKAKGKPAPRRRLTAEEAREAILRAAEELLISSGPDALRLTEVAARAGVAHANISYHFGNVAGLELRLAERIATGLADDIARVYVNDGSKTPPFEQAVARTFRVFDEQGYARLLAWLALAFEDQSFQALGSKLQTLCAVIAVHPGFAGSEGAERARRYIVASVQLSICAALGYGLIGDRLEALFPTDERRVTVVKLLGEVFAGLVNGRA